MDSDMEILIAMTISKWMNGNKKHMNIGYTTFALYRFCDTLLDVELFLKGLRS